MATDALQSTDNKAQSLPLISVIVPSYNVEKYLMRCVDSIIAQTHENLEIILVIRVDDGSADKSIDICEDYARLDSRVRVIRQKTSGVSAARNEGLDAARGEWIGFVDADDWIKPQMYEKLLKAAVASNKLISCCNYLKYYSEDNQKAGMHEMPEIMTREQSIMCFLDVKHRYGILHWCSLFHHSVFERKGNKPIRFETTIHAAEDALFMVNAFIEADGIAYVPEMLHYYFLRPGSAVHSIDDKKLTRIIAYEKIMELALPFSEDIVLLSQLRYAWAALDQASLFCHIRQYTHVPMLRCKARRYAFAMIFSSKFSVTMRVQNLAALYLPKSIVGALSRLKRRKMFA